MSTFVAHVSDVTARHLQCT